MSRIDLKSQEMGGLTKCFCSISIFYSILSTFDGQEIRISLSKSHQIIDHSPEYDLDRRNIDEIQHKMKKLDQFY